MAQVCSHPARRSVRVSLSLGWRWGGTGTWGLGFHPASHRVPHSCRQRQSGCRSSTGLSRRPWRRVCEWLPPSSGTGGPSEPGGCSQGEEGVTLPGPG